MKCYSTMHEEMLTYGLKKGTENTLKHIDEVPNGLACDCVCPHCHHPLIARNGGKKKEHHFAHVSGADCGKGRMTALHMLAQQILARDNTVMLPAYQGEYYQQPAQRIRFDKVNLEVSYDINGKLLRPDCVGVKIDEKCKNHSLWIEIYVTHDVDETKIQYVKESGYSCIEIDLSDMLVTDYNEDNISTRLLEREDDRKWINCPNYDKKEEQVRLKRENEIRESTRKKEEEYRRRQDEYREQGKLVANWKINDDSISTQQIIKAIKETPYSKYTPDKKCIVDFVFPNEDWINLIRNHPKTNNGKDVFYTLLHYYYQIRDNKINYHEDEMNQLLNKERSEKDEITLEYMLIIWTLRQIQYFYHLNPYELNTNYGKLLVDNKNVREKYIEFVKQLGKLEALSSVDIQSNDIAGDLSKILDICKRIKLYKKSRIPKESLNMGEEIIEYDNSPIGFDKELEWKNINELWKQANQAFQEQSHK